MNNLFPKFVQNRPKGLDKFDGASQTKLAKAIAKQIIVNDALPKDVNNNRKVYHRNKYNSLKIFGCFQDKLYLCARKTKTVIPRI